METRNTLAGELTSRDLRPDAVIRAARQYVAERLHYTAADDLRDDLAERVIDGAALPATIADSPRLLLGTALGVLSAAWEQPDERERIRRALDDPGGKLPAGDMLPVAATLVYGLYLLARAGVVSDESTTMGPDGSYEHRKIERRGALAILLPAFTRQPAPALPGPRPGLPGEGNFTVLLFDIRKSVQLPQPDQDRGPFALRDLVSAALADLSISTFDSPPPDRGDGWLVLIPDAAGALTSIVNSLPSLIRRRLDTIPHPRLRVRMGVHCGRLRHVEEWVGAPLVHVTRMINDDNVESRLEQPGKRLLTVLSDRVYEEICVTGYADAAYEPVDIAVKETTARVWLTAS